MIDSEEDISCIFDGIGNHGSIYISNFATAENIELLKELKIQAILTICKKQLTIKNCQLYLFLQAEDHDKFDITIHFENAYEFIQNARKKTNILIHCMQGISRSSTIVIAYLMKKHKLYLNQVFTLVKRKRKIINPNQGFIYQLNRYAIECNPQDPGFTEKLISKKNFKNKFPSFQHMKYSQKIAKNRFNSETMNKNSQILKQLLNFNEILQKAKQKRISLTLAQEEDKSENKNIHKQITEKQIQKPTSKSIKSSLKIGKKSKLKRALTSDFQNESESMSQYRNDNDNSNSDAISSKSKKQVMFSKNHIKFEYDEHPKRRKTSIICMQKVANLSQFSLTLSKKSSKQFSGKLL